MRLCNVSTVFSTTLFLAYIFSFSQVSAQDLPKLSSSAADATSSAAAASTTQTSGASAAASSSSSTITSAAAASSSILPGLSSSSYDGITNAPTLAGSYDYPAPSVPPTAEAPYMQKSPLPEGTVFICVGAVLGFLTVVIIAWRSVVVWSIHRSVRRSSPQRYGHEYGTDAKASMLRNAAIPFYSHGPGSTLSLDQFGPTGKSGGTKAHAPNESLFFSPTATTGAGAHSHPNRGSSYLPAGYYAAGNSALGGGAGITHLGGRPISLVDMGSQHHGHQRARSIGPTPPLSPSLPPSRGVESTSTLNLPQRGRVPSAYLDELFDSYPPDHTSEGRSTGDRRY